jgi:glycosyltransferase involved in cell wall biosynthesis
MNIPIVQEACEWWPGTANATALNAWMYKNIMFKWSDGAIVISHAIQNRINALVGSAYPVCMVPVLVDPAENTALTTREAKDVSASPVLLWCGMADGYARDVYFLIDAMARLQSTAGNNSLLRIVGPCTKKFRDKLLSYANSKNIPAARLDIVGFVSDAQLWNYCTKADALLMPMWDDDRSITRFPTKLGQYLASGRPIITARVGEVKHFLSDETAMFYLPGDANSLAHSLDSVLSDPPLGEKLATRATEVVLPRVDYRSNAQQICKWFCQIFSKIRQR